MSILIENKHSKGSHNRDISDYDTFIKRSFQMRRLMNSPQQKIESQKESNNSSDTEYMCIPMV